jgi:hypothetical protein
MGYLSAPAQTLHLVHRRIGFMVTACCTVCDCETVVPSGIEIVT